MTVTPERAFPNRLIASPYHTVGLLGLIIALSLITRLFVTSRPATTLRTEHLQVYLLGFSWDWLLFLYVRIGLKRRRVRTIRQVLDDRDWTFVRWLLYLAIAVGLVFLWGALGFALGRFLNIDAEQAARIRSLFPSSLLDRTVWVVLSITAGFCEEFVYRGYLQQQFRAMTGSLSLAVVLQASAFGAAHLAFPWQIALMTVLLGLLVGTVAGWRRSLAPGMLFHAAFDILSGVLS